MLAAQTTTADAHTFTKLRRSMVTIGIGFVARGLVTMIPGWGTDTHMSAAYIQGQS